MKIPIEISARHAHLCRKDMESLFGSDYELKINKNISQPGQFAVEETINIKNGDNKIENIRIVGPLRDYSQVEISMTDAYLLKIEVPIRISGDIDNTPGIELIGPAGSVTLSKGLIIAQRHLHISPVDATQNNLKHGQIISIKTAGERAVVFNNVTVRSREGIDTLAFHIDTDEGNAAGVKSKDEGETI